MRDPTVWAGARQTFPSIQTSIQLVSDPRGAAVVQTQPSSENSAYRGPRWAAAGASVSAGMVARSSQRSMARVNGRCGRAECPACPACYEFRIQVDVNPKIGAPAERAGPRWLYRIGQAQWRAVARPPGHVVDPPAWIPQSLSGPSSAFGSAPVEKTLDFRARWDRGLSVATLPVSHRPSPGSRTKFSHSRHSSFVCLFQG